MKEAQLQKYKNYMNQKVLDNGYIVTRYEFIDEKLSRGFYPEKRIEPRYKFNRLKYNKMTSDTEQDLYEKKCEELKDVYYLITKDNKKRIKITKNMYKYATEK